MHVLLQALTAVTSSWPGFAGPAGEPLRRAPQAELLSLAGDRSRPGTVAFAVHQLTGIAAGIREQLSTDTWLVLGSLERELRRLGVEAGDPQATHRDRRPGAGAAHGAEPGPRGPARAERAGRREPGPRCRLAVPGRRPPGRARDPRHQPAADDARPGTTGRGRRAGDRVGAGRDREHHHLPAPALGAGRRGQCPGAGAARPGQPQIRCLPGGSAAGGPLRGVGGRRFRCRPGPGCARPGHGSRAAL